jgi:hypothetical protein
LHFVKFKLAALAATLLTIGAVGGTVASQNAQAFAWKDTCRLIATNHAEQSQTRPIALGQIPPNPVSYSIYAVLLATGMPKGTGAYFSTTGFPITNGCHQTIQFRNPGTDVTCNADAPTTGANTFWCNGNSTFKIDTDNDDISGTVVIAVHGAGSEPEPEALSLFSHNTKELFASHTSAPPKPPRGALEKGQLSGKGWRRSEKVSDLGTFGKLLEASTPSGKCGDANDAHEPTPASGGGSLFVRGGEAIGEFDGRYGSDGQAERTLAAATSAGSIRCLAASLTAPGYRATVAPRGPDFGQGGISTSRIVVKQNGGGFTGYVDVVGLADGRSNTVLVFFNRGKPAEVSHEEDVLEAVADNLRP